MQQITKLVRPIAALLLTLVLVFFSGGWGRDGHAIVANIAWRELSPEARDEIKKLLGESSLPEIASWADVVRRDPNYDWSAPMHYVNMPIDATGYDHERDCPPEGCVVSAVDRFAAVLKDRNASAQDRGEALMFIVHFVGDMHQPMHGGRAEDRGGNSIEITFFDESTNLHRIWDSGILNASSNETWPERADRLYDSIDEMDRVAWLADTAEANWLDSSGRWAFESHNLAEQYAYIVTNNSTVGAEYVSETAPVAELRLKQAGIRLAAVLEDCLGPGSAD
ncbi:MAG: S1/P1 nuclease [Phycisphaerales bacterium]